MDGQALGKIVRAVRVRHRWRQADVASRARVSVATVSRIERGLLDTVAVGLVGRVAVALEIQVGWTARWRGGELDRMLSAGHAAMHETMTRDLASAGWLMAPEASFSIYGERGIIDILAFHPPTGSLLVVELKTELVDIGGLIGVVDRYRRLAPSIARGRGWDASTVSCWVALRDTPTNHRRLAAHASVLRTAFPADGRRIRGWLRRPVGTVACLGFLSVSGPRSGSAASSGVRRVRV